MRAAQEGHYMADNYTICSVFLNITMCDRYTWH